MQRLWEEAECVLVLVQVVNMNSLDADRNAWVEGYVYVGRSGHGFSGLFGNPFLLGRDGTRDEVCDKFDAWLDNHLVLVEILRAMNPTHLVCFCAPQRCHAESYVRRLTS